jgi:hypothetical protein
MAAFTLTEPQYSADRKGPWRLYTYSPNSPHHQGGVWFMDHPKHPEEGDITTDEALQRCTNTIMENREVRVCDTGDMLVYHFDGKRVLHGESFWNEVCPNFTTVSDANGNVTHVLARDIASPYCVWSECSCGHVMLAATNVTTPRTSDAAEFGGVDDERLLKFVSAHPEYTVAAVRLNHETIASQMAEISRLRGVIRDIQNKADELDERLRHTVVHVGIRPWHTHSVNATLSHVLEVEHLSRPLCPNCSASDCEGCLLGMAATGENVEWIEKFMRRELP